HDLPGYTANIDVLQNAAKGIGYVTIVPDIDGVIRRAQLVLKHEGKLYPSLALQTAMNYQLFDDASLATIQEGESLVVTGLNLENMFGEKKFVATDPQAQILIPYRGKRGMFPYIPATDVMHGNVAPELLENAIAIIGTSAAGLLDLRTTPLETGYPGVEAQATIIDALLMEDAPQTPDWAIGANVAGITLLGLLLSFIMPNLGPQKMILLAFAMTVFVVANNYYFWFYQNLNLDLAIPLLLVFVLCSANLCFGFFTEASQRNAIKSAFDQYVAPAHIDKLLNQGDDLSFEGETKEMTVLFCDIRGFTSISEKLTANELKNMLNEFFTPMTEIIFEQMGTIDKYVGDMIMAFWGAPIDDPDQKHHAVSAAIIMQKKVEALKNEFKEKGYPEVNIGIGLNTGIMNVGDMGSVYRRAYTVLGDAVNLGSRLESITKFYGAKILVSEATMTDVDEVVFREVDYIQVKGKDEPIRVFEPVCFKKEADKILLDNIARYNQARKHFLDRHWQLARSIFVKLATDDPGIEKLCSVYLERIRIFEKEPPAEDWTGVWRHDSK
ncbi:MAG: adenylate/guanylate cyclase domain-containing protein, partial [Pseudomonadales bacterium]|nr:adenylate/guanylate cyclase domain-containing protein [Pseudomonadales bacterium]